ncbi:MAG: hemerythrin domain-containing protein [Mycobacteriaceae bacterium]|nr:hemerythrin domain-containing protein [Mycobacteriaceae bacterium]MBV9638735.1 hemerythrin domain-containing protein [Mycobacteriaceae bacterium]
MTDTGVNSTGDVVAFLKDQHDQIKRLFAQTLDATDTESGDKAFFELRRLLAVHETAEEMVVHPLARRTIAFGEGIVDARLKEENEAKHQLASIEKMDVGSTEFGQALAQLQSAVLEHARHEEVEEFTKLSEDLDEGNLKRAATMVRMAERMAPTRPHPGVELATVNMAVGPFAAMLDRARDALKDIG